MIEDMAARKLNPNTQRSHIYSCKRFAAWLKRSPDTATPDEVRGFQLHLIESGTSICNRNRIMTGVRFLFRVTLRRHDLAAEVWHIKEPDARARSNSYGARRNTPTVPPHPPARAGSFHGAKRSFGDRRFNRDNFELCTKRSTLAHRIFWTFSTQTAVLSRR